MLSSLSHQTRYLFLPLLPRPDVLKAPVLGKLGVVLVSILRTMHGPMVCALVFQENQMTFYLKKMLSA